MIYPLLATCRRCTTRLLATSHGADPAASRARVRLLHTGRGPPGAEAGPRRRLRQRNTDVALYGASTVLCLLALSYASVPLYRLFCQATGYGGTPRVLTDSSGDENEEENLRMKPVRGAAPITIRFNADVSDSLPWEFRPLQRELRVVPGQTALAFYTARNRSDRDIIGISTYNVTPQGMGPYFNKVQCFCFEEQRLRAGESVDMPVFFFVDPEILDDPFAARIRNVILSYTFFNAKTEAAKLHH